MPTATRPPRNGASAPARPRRWLLSAPVPLPNLGDYATLIAIYDLDAAMSFDWNVIAPDLTQQFNALDRQERHIIADLNAAWPTAEVKKANLDGWDDADQAAAREIRALQRQRLAVSRQMDLLALPVLILKIQGPEGDEITDPGDPASWDGWSDHMLNWLTTKGRLAAQEQLIGPKSPPATATPSR